MYCIRNIFRVTGNQRGMTLLEIMLALLILGTVVTMVSITLSGSLNILNATQDHGAIYHRAQVALLRISEDIASTVLLEGVEDPAFVGIDEQLDGQDADTLQFASTAHIVFNRTVDKPGIALISYRVEEDQENDGEFLLIRSDELLAITSSSNGGGKDEGGFLLSDKLRSVNFSYIDEEGEELDDWTTDPEALSKPSDQKLPVAVSCTLEFWVDQENDSSVEFTTSILLPAGLINAPTP
jgi:prepilin-type N-terminal cleavage/methylation domain-containing protein